jgi:D-sedoheptulose 7-phosphate isomerase
MKACTSEFIADFFARHEDLKPLQEKILQAGNVLMEAFRQGNQVLLCGNGGSCADCDHIAGEFLKGFLLKRPVHAELKEALAQYGESGVALGMKLQQGLPAISLTAHAGAISAFSNDVDPEMVYAQQVLAYGKPGDVLIGISTSGNAKNVLGAARAAKVRGAAVIGLTGMKESKLSAVADVCIRVPDTETYRIQEYHLPVYHWLCALVEEAMFDQ